MSYDKITRIWDDAKEQLAEDEDEDEETEELSGDALDGRIAELEKKYDQYQQATRSNSGRGWEKVAENTREKLIDLKEQKLGEIAEEHDSLDRSSYIGAMKDKSRLNDEYHELEGDIEELER